MISFLITMAILYYFGFYIMIFVVAIITEMLPYIKIGLIISIIYFAVKLFIKLFLYFKNKNKNKFK